MLETNNNTIVKWPVKKANIDTIIRVHLSLSSSHKDFPLAFTWFFIITNYFNSLISDLVRVGNDITPSRTGLNASNTILLLNDPIQEAGVLFAWSAFFRGPSKVWWSYAVLFHLCITLQVVLLCPSLYAHVLTI